MEFKIAEVAERIRTLREILEITPEEMAKVTETTTEEYLKYESGERDFSFTFLFNCANRFGVDLTDLVTGEGPHLSGYSLVRRDEGLKIKRRQGFQYQNMAYLFKQRMAEPFIVTAPYSKEMELAPVSLSCHAGQEMDLIIEGSLRFYHDGHEELLNPGDCVYYDSIRPHGMVAAGGKECTFLAVVMKKESDGGAES